MRNSVSLYHILVLINILKLVPTPARHRAPELALCRSSGFGASIFRGVSTKTAAKKKQPGQKNKYGNVDMNECLIDENMDVLQVVFFEKRVWCAGCVLYYE